MSKTTEKAAWIKWFYQDFLSDGRVAALDHIQRGWYALLLTYSCTYTPKGHLPTSVQRLFNMLGVPNDQRDPEMLAPVLALFDKTADGEYYYHPKILSQVIAWQTVIAQNKAAGKASAAQRALNTRSTPVATKRQRAFNQTETETDTEEKAKTPCSPPFDSEQAIDRIFRHYPKVMEEPRSKSAIAQALAELSPQMGGDADAVVFLETMTQKYRLLVTPFRNIPELWDQVLKPWKWFEAKKYNDDPATWMPVGAQDGKGRDERESRNGNSVRAKQNRSFDAIGAALKRKLGEREPDAGGDEVAIPEPRDHGRGSGVVIDAVGAAVPGVRPAQGTDGDDTHPRDEQVLSQRGRGAGGD